MPISNTGGDTLVKLDATLAKTGSARCDASTLASGESATCTATFVVEIADIANGGIASTVTLTATNQSTGSTVTASKQMNAKTEIPLPGIAMAPLVAVVNTGLDYAVPGDTINWTTTVTNTGNVLLSEVAVDSDIGGAVTCDATSLAPNTSTKCSAGPYTVTDLDVKPGAVVTTLTARARSAQGENPLPAAQTATVKVVLPVDASVLMTPLPGIPGVNTVTIATTTQPPASSLVLKIRSTKPVHRVKLDIGTWTCRGNGNLKSLDCSTLVTPSLISFTGNVRSNTRITVDLTTPGNVDPNLANNHAEQTFTLLPG